MTSQNSPLTTALPPAGPPTLTLGATSTTYTASGSTLVFPNATIADNGNKIDGVQVRIEAGTGSLSIAGVALDANGLGTSGKISIQYLAATKLLRLSENSANPGATTSDFQTALDQVSISGATGSVSISANLGKPVYRSATGEYYEFVTSGSSTALTTWTTAKTNAEASTLYGLQGYLATITSQAENDFLTNTFASRGWIGAQADSNRKWTWVGGPEAGKAFWQGNANGTLVTTDSINYANWDTGEPNNFTDPTLFPNGESYAQFTTGGVWNDLANDPTAQTGDKYRPNGYWIEYGNNDGSASLAGTRGSIALTQGNTSTNPQLDLVFYDPAKGQASFGFTSNGYNIASNTTATDAPALTNNVGGTTPQFGSSWRFVSGSVDVDKDGIKDIIVVNKIDNSVVVFFGEARTGGSRQFAYTRSGYVTNATGQIYRPGTNWTLDFASDKIGANDSPGLFWRSKDGVSAVWSMTQPVTTTNGVTNIAIVSSGAIFTAGANSGWRAIGDGEFNSDRATREVFWVNDINSQVVTWSLTGARALSSGKLAWSGLVNTSAYSVAGIGNVSGLTGVNDNIVWQIGGSVIVWNMLNGAYAATGSAVATVTSTDKIKLLADVNGDGTLDLVGEASDGSIAAYTLLGTYANKDARTLYTSNTSSTYRPAKGGTATSPLELVNVSQYGV